MFKKNNDTFLKITNMILIIITSITLGIGIGNNYYIEKNSDFYCGQFRNSLKLDTYTNGDDAENNYTASCTYSKTIGLQDSYKAMNVSYSISCVSFVALILSNIFKNSL